MERSAMLIALLVAGIPATAPQKPVQIVPIHVENRNRMQSVDELWAAADLVIEGAVDASRAVDRPDHLSPQTAFDIRVLEIYKPDGRVTTPGGLVQVRRSGGDRDRGDHVERYVPDDYPMFEVGERYILFLRAHALPGELFYSTSSLSAEGVFRMVGNSVQARGRQDFSRTLALGGVESLRRLLRDRRRQP